MPSSSLAAGPRWRIWLLTALVIGGVFALYGKTLSYSYLHWDDPVYVTSRPALQQLGQHQTAAWSRLLSPRDALQGRFWEFFPTRDLTYGIDAWRGRLQPASFHQTNVLLHALAACLVLWLGWLFRLRWWACGLAALVFAAHPLAVEPVAWISGRKDLLYSFFCLAAVGAGRLYLFPEPSGEGEPARASWLAWLGVGLLVLLSFGSKGPGVIVVGLLVWWSFRLPASTKRTRIWWRMVPWCLAALGWVWLTIQIGRRNNIISTSTDGFVGSLWRALGAPLRAFQRFLFPVSLSPSYGGWEGAWWTDPHSLASCGLLLLLVLFASRQGLSVIAWLRDRWKDGVPLPWLLAGSVMLSMLPNSGIVAVNQPQADRFYYLSLAWLSLLLAWLVQRRVWLAGLVLVGLAGMLWQSHSYIAAWRSDGALWKHVYQQEPTHPVAGVQLALLAMQQKRDGLAYKLLKQVTKHHPNMPSAWSNLGVWWHTQARRSKGARQAHARRQALRAYLQAKAVGARAPQIDNGLALLYAASGQQARAVSHYQKALSGSRVPPVVALNYVRFLWKQGKRKQAHTLVRLWSRRFPRYRPYRRWLAKHMPTSLPTRP